MIPETKGNRAPSGPFRSQPPVDRRDAPLAARELARIRRSRASPRPTQFDYLHLRRLREDIASALGALPVGVRDVLDVYCGTRPYEDVLPPGARCVGLDVDDRYGAADVVTDDFLPFPDRSFDLVTCYEGFYYVADPAVGVGELARVLRPGGHAIVTVPLVWEYDRRLLEHRFTGPQLQALFEGWSDVTVVENGGRGVVWATQTGHLASLVEDLLTQRMAPLAAVVHPFFVAVYLAINGIGAAIERLDRRLAGPRALPMNLLLTARKV